MKTIWRKFKYRGFIIVALLLGIIIIFANRTYSASDVLGNYGDLNAENPFVSIESIDVQTEVVTNE